MTARGGSQDSQGARSTRRRLIDAAVRDDQLADQLAGEGRAQEAAAKGEDARRTLAENGLTLLRRDPELGSWSLLEEQAGPAGVAELRLDGVLVEVDFADPATIVAVEIEPGSRGAGLSSAARETVSALVSEEAVRALEGELGPVEAVPVAVDEPARTRRRAVGRLALLARSRAASDDPRDDPLWAAEAALLARQSGIAALWTQRGVRDVDAALPGLRQLAEQSELPAPLRQRALEILDELLPALGEGSLEKAVAAARRGLSEAASADELPAEPTLAQVNSSLAHARAILEQPAGSEPAPRPVRAREIAAGLADESWAFTLASWLAPRYPLTRQEAQVGWRPGEGLLTVTLWLSPGTTPDPPLWCRVFPVRDRTPIAIAPFVNDPASGETVATLRVPRGLARDSFVLDATDRPSVPPPPSVGEVLASAVAVGQAACELERRAAGAESWTLVADAWKACARLWARLDDDNRQALALAYAATVYRRVGEVVLAAECIREGRRLAAGWASERLERWRAPAAPFLAELGPRRRATAPRWRLVKDGVFELAGAVRAILTSAGRVIVDVPTGLVSTPLPVAARDPAQSVTERLHVAHDELDLRVELRLTVRGQRPGRLELVLGPSGHREAIVRVLQEGGSPILRRPVKPGETVVCEIPAGTYVLEVTSPAGSLRVRLEIEEP